MPYVDLAGLSRYASRQKDRLERDCALLRDMQWLRTEKAGAVSCWPVGGTELKPVVDFLFSETGPESGDKGPDNPSTIAGVDSIFIRRTSENFVTTPYKWFADSQSTSYTDHGVTYTLNPDNSITINGTANGNSYFALLGEDGQNVWFPAGTYTIKAPNISASLAIVFYYGSSIFVYTTDTVRTFNRGFFGRIYYRISSGTTVNNAVVYPQVFFNAEEASTFSVVPNYASTFPLGSTYYGGSIDLAAGVMTVDWEYVSIDRFYNCYVNSNTIRFSYNTNFDTTGYVYGQDPVGACNRFDVVPGGDTEFARQTGNPREMFVAINKSRLDVSGAVDPSNPTNSEWLAAGNAWLVEHPVVFIAKRATPYTVQLDPVSISALVQSDKYTPRLNTIYTDASAVQVGYVKSPIRDEYELQQAVIAQGGNV